MNAGGGRTNRLEAGVWSQRGCTKGMEADKEGDMGSPEAVIDAG